MAEQTPLLLKEFDAHFNNWVEASCQDWNYPMPDEDYYLMAFERLPEGLRALLGFGLKSGLIVPEGGGFRLKDLPSYKGPYQWFSKNRNLKPTPNWEYFVQAAEFVRLTTIAETHGLTVNFEDDTMDITLSQGSKLIAYYEVKEKVSRLQRLIKGIKDYGYSIDLNLSAPDRGNDPLRKAKIIVKRRPEYFSGLAIGTRFEYKVVYPKEGSFQLVRDVIPWV